MAPRERFNKQLAYLHVEMTDMGAQVHGVINRTVRVLEANDLTLAQQIFDGDDVVDGMERHIEQMCLSLITRESPIATDLRHITASLKIITDLERAADQCADICEIVARALGTPQIPAAQMLPGMLQKASDLFGKALDAFLDEDEEKAQQVISQDEEIDALFYACIGALRTSLGEDPKSAAQAVNTMMIAKYIERIGDHATNIAEWAIYLATGRHPREVYLESGPQ